MQDKLTLRQGLELFYHDYAGHLSHEKEALSSDVVDFFKAHDVAHVLFACDISLYGEGLVKIWTIFGTDMGFWNHLKAYKSAEAFTLAQRYSAVHILRHIFRFMVKIPVVIFRARKMSEKWKWYDYESYLDIPLEEIRNEFNIQIV